MFFTTLKYVAWAGVTVCSAIPPKFVQRFLYIYKQFRTCANGYALTKILEGTLHAIDTFTKRRSVTKQRDKACK